MPKKRLIILLLISIVTVCLLIPLSACGGGGKAGQVKIEYPTKPVVVIHGFKPGGGSDQLAQLVQPYLEKVLGQRFVNEYKPGASGAIACKEVANSKPDGYTLTTCMFPTTFLPPLINKNAGYSMSDFKLIANIIFDPGILVVPINSKFNNVKELLDYARNNPGQLKIGDNGLGGDDWYNLVIMERLTGLKFNHIPFEGDAPACQAAAGGHVDATSTNVSIAYPMIKGGKLKALAVYSENRIPALPDVPTLKEAGVDMVEGSYRGYMAPKGVPDEIIDILVKGLEKVVNDPAFQKACEDVNLQIKFVHGQEYRNMMDEKAKALEKLCRDMNLIGSAN